MRRRIQWCRGTRTTDLALAVSEGGVAVADFDGEAAVLWEGREHWRRRTVRQATVAGGGPEGGVVATPSRDARWEVGSGAITVACVGRSAAVHRFGGGGVLREVGAGAIARRRRTASGAAACRWRSAPPCGACRDVRACCRAVEWWRRAKGGPQRHPASTSEL
ncbi:Os02g0789833 [Oryza sativa Japonica Group]|uniref:Os02g0789833 protein n=2 Tax=Oryza sativa subsp. japonica TaxID=39947 RepID=Q6KAF6_ORYSJ|nr:hypothetical protein [Oryza sativa Japonica Group]BAS81308.1 Os02g0789833 [Oryza sativa Japonica Group]